MSCVRDPSAGGANMNGQRSADGGFLVGANGGLPGRVFSILITQPWSILIFFTPENIYRVSNVLVDMGWFDFDLGIPPYCLAASSKFPLAQEESGRQWNTQKPSHAT